MKGEDSLEEQMGRLEEVWGHYTTKGSGRTLSPIERAFVWNEAKFRTGHGWDHENGRTSEEIERVTEVSPRKRVQGFEMIDHLPVNKQTGLQLRSQHLVDIAKGRKSMRVGDKSKR